MSERTDTLLTYFFRFVERIVPELVQITRFKKTEFYTKLFDLEKLRNTRIRPSQLPVRELSKTIAGSIVTDSSTPVPDCLTCGACCAFALLVSVTPAESGALPAYWDVTLDAGDTTINRALPRNLETGYCTFLQGNVGENIYCDIYPDRPHLCRDFEAGSDRCHADRRMYGIEPPLTDAEVAEAMSKLEQVRPPEKISYASIENASLRTTFDREGNLLAAVGILKIVAYIDKDTETKHELHQFDPSKETWFENEFLGLSLDEAKELIASRTNQIS
jgi:uncharacterized protein